MVGKLQNLTTLSKAINDHLGVLGRISYCLHLENLQQKHDTVGSRYSEDFGSSKNIHYIINLHYIMNLYFTFCILVSMKNSLYGESSLFSGSLYREPTVLY